jgi:CHAT domain-containing protein/tetratricopeptide (TPR) repeat protein
MQNPRYYRLVPTLLCILLAGHVAAAQTPAPPPPDAATACDELKHDPLPAWIDSADHSKRLIDCGYALRHDGDYARAERVFVAALDMAKRQADRAAEAAALDGYGATLVTLGQPDRAEPVLQQGFALGEELGDRTVMAEVSTQLGHLRTMRARYDEAREFHLRSYTLWQAIGNRPGMAVALNNVGATYQSAGDYVSAADYFQRSLTGLEDLGDQRRSATVIDNLARISRILGDYAKGLALSQRAFEIRRGLDDKDGIARSLTSLSESYRAQGNYTAALDSLQQSLALSTEIGYAHAIAETLNNIAVVYEAQGNYAQAATYLRKSLAFNDARVGSPSLTAEIRTHLGEVFLGQGDPAKAVASLQRSLTISARQGFEPQAADARLVLGRAFAAQHQLGPAAQAFRRVLQFRETAGDRGGRAEALVALADVERRSGRYAAALTLATDAQALAEEMELVDVQWLALTVAGRIDVALKRPADARRAFEQAIDVVEDLRAQNPGDEETRRQFFADRLAPYHERIELALATNHTADAFYFAERSRARALLDVMRSDRMPVTKAMTAPERTREIELRTSLNSVNSEVLLAARAVPRDEPRLAALKGKRDARRLAYEAFRSGLYSAHPELQVDRGAAPVVRAPEAQRLLPGSSAAIVEFVAGPIRTDAFVITGAGIRSFRLPATTSTLGGQVRRFRDQLAHRDLRAADSARALYDAVLGPMRASLQGITELIVVPDGILWELPFQALQPSAGRYLIEDAAISYAPSVTVLREAMRRRAEPHTASALLAFANPAGPDPLPETETEATKTADVYGPSSRVFVGADASEGRWKSEAPKYGVLHLATHGVLDNASPLYSHLTLARPGPGDREDGVLEAWELMNMQLRAELVVLSGCDTARGQVAPGEGIIGLMWAVLVAGAPATLVSQWAVESASATRVMVAFHQQWRGGQRGVSKARALQLAAVQVLKTGGLEHPFYWAGFILGGDGR